MGGSSPKPTPKPTEKKPAAPTFQTVQPFMPGFQNDLAQQLSMGFGGNPNDFLKQFAQTYAPMQLPISPVFLNPTPATPAAPATPPKTRGSDYQ